MVDRRLYQNALAFAARKHRGQFRIGGAPYITHPVAVAEILKEEGCGTETVVTGLLHDLLEDTDAKESEIEAIAGERVLRAVRTLTKTPGYVMADYVAAIRDDPIAFAVKGVDRLHNLRCAVLCGESFRRRYAAESRLWYWDFHPLIPRAVGELEKTLEK